MYKVCTTCGLEKPEESFAFNYKSKNSRINRCKSCVSLKTKEWKEKNKDRPREICYIENCEKFVTAKKLCSAHYTRLVRHGSTELPIVPPKVDPEYKICSRCNIEKNTATEFYISNKTKTSLSHCKLCHQIYARKNALLRKYNLSEEDYDLMLKKQNYSCAICNKHELDNDRTNVDGDTPYRLAVDHNHTTGEIRGLLCNQCNRFIGLANDDLGILSSAVNYLSSYL